MPARLSRADEQLAKAVVTVLLTHYKLGGGSSLVPAARLTEASELTLPKSPEFYAYIREMIESFTDYELTVSPIERTLALQYLPLLTPTMERCSPLALCPFSSPLGTAPLREELAAGGQHTPLSELPGDSLIAVLTGDGLYVEDTRPSTAT